MDRKPRHTRTIGTAYPPFSLLISTSGGYILGVLAVTNMLLAAAAAERLAAKRATADSERRLRMVVKDQTELICRFSPEARLTFVNGAYWRGDRP